VSVWISILKCMYLENGKMGVGRGVGGLDSMEDFPDKVGGV
jgi:hypothetical protein